MALPRATERVDAHHSNSHINNSQPYSTLSSPRWSSTGVQADSSLFGVAPSLFSDVSGVVKAELLDTPPSTPPRAQSQSQSHANNARAHAHQAKQFHQQSTTSTSHSGNNTNSSPPGLPLRSLDSWAAGPPSSSDLPLFDRAVGGVGATPSADLISPSHVATQRAKTTSSITTPKRGTPLRISTQTHPRSRNEREMIEYLSPHEEPGPVDRGSPGALANCDRIPHVREGNMSVRSRAYTEAVLPKMAGAMEKSSLTRPSRGATSRSARLTKSSTALGSVLTAWTRYIVVDGFDKNSSDQDVIGWINANAPNARTHNPSKLASDGQLLLAFYDAHEAGLSMVKIEEDGRYRARSLTRGEVATDFIKNATEQAKFLSRSEGVCILELKIYSPLLSAFNSKATLGIYGDVRSIEGRDGGSTFVCDFYDERCAERAVVGLNGAMVDGVRLSCKLGTPPKMRPQTWPPQPPSLVPSPQDAYTHPPWSPPTSPACETLFSPTMPAFFLGPPPPPPGGFALGPPSPISPLSPLSPPLTAVSMLPLSPMLTPAPVQVSPSARSWRRASTSMLPGPSQLWQPQSFPPNGARSIGPPHLGPFDSPSLPAVENLSLGPRLQSGFTSPTPTSPLFSPRLDNSSRPRGPPLRGHARAASLSSLGSTTTASSAGPPAFGIYREDRIPANNQIDQRLIEQGKEVRTTIMLKNLPNKLSADEVMAYVDEMFDKKPYDGFYLRIDFQAKNNVGYAFINFLTPQLLLKFLKAKVGTRYNLAQSDKICSATWANIQGRESFIDHFRNSSVMDQPDENRPKIFYSKGPNQGQREPFPSCTDPLRKQRSAQNQRVNGLFPSQKPDFKVRPLDGSQPLSAPPVPGLVPYRPPHARQA